MAGYQREDNFAKRLPKETSQNQYNNVKPFPLFSLILQTFTSTFFLNFYVYFILISCASKQAENPFDLKKKRIKLSGERKIKKIVF